MRHHIRTFTARHEPQGAAAAHMKAGLGAMIGILVVGGLAAATELHLLIAPLGASAVLVFGQPASPLAQPVNVFGGYLLSTLVAVAAAIAFPGIWWVAGIGVGVAIALMAILRVTHPPAGAVPIVALTAPMESAMLFPTILLASISLVGLALVHHRLPPRIQYPKLPHHPGASIVPLVPANNAVSSAEIPDSKAA